MKICVISFDFWHYDGFIVEELRRQKVQATHINFGALQHKNWRRRLANAFSKVVLRKNLKNENRWKYILAQLENLGVQDHILILNPELIPIEIHQKIKNYTRHYTAYLYDSLARCPAQHLFPLFDKIFTFDRLDAEKYAFQLITNYNYLPERLPNTASRIDLKYLASADRRLLTAKKIEQQMASAGKLFRATIVGKSAWMQHLKNYGENFIFSRKRISISELPEFYHEAKAMLDVVREQQTGLSFRFFEAMALKKKIVTNNAEVQHYDFYNPQNILILDENLSGLKAEFFETSYEELPKEIYQKYTLEQWVKTIFQLP